MRFLDKNKERNKNNVLGKRIVVFAGPSGSGKNTIMHEIIKRSKKISKFVTATTRKKREGEKDGVDYYFLSEEEFKEKMKQGLIPEHNIHAFNYYGTYLPDLDKKLKEGKIVFGQVQLVGAKYLKENYNALTLFFVADSLKVLEERIRQRSKLSEEEIKERIRVAKREIEEESKFYDYIIENKQDQLEETVEKVIKILKKEGIKI